MAKKRTKQQKMAASQKHQAVTPQSTVDQSPITIKLEATAPLASKKTLEVPTGMLLSTSEQLRKDWTKTLIVTIVTLCVLGILFYWLR